MNYKHSYFLWVLKNNDKEKPASFKNKCIILKNGLSVITLLSIHNILFFSVRLPCYNLSAFSCYNMKCVLKQWPPSKANKFDALLNGVLKKIYLNSVNLSKVFFYSVKQFVFHIDTIWKHLSLKINIIHFRLQILHTTFFFNLI